MAQHTPGPWRLIYTAEHGCYRDVAGSGGRIGATCRAGRIARVDHIPEAWGDAEANARLIAAAPDLLEALREIASWDIPHNEPGTRKHSLETRALETHQRMRACAAAAVARAEGREEG